MSPQEQVLQQLIKQAQEASPLFAQKIAYWTKRQKPIQTDWLYIQLRFALPAEVIKEALDNIKITQD